MVGTPGLITTRSSWSRSQPGASPARQPMPSCFKASAPALHFSSGCASLRTTVAPRAVKNFAQAIPLRAAPITRTFLPATSKQFHVPVGQTLLSILLINIGTGRNACPTSASRLKDSTMQTGSPESESETQSSILSNLAFQSGDAMASS